MREILFRGKNVIGGQWLNGDLIHTTTGKAPMIRTHGKNSAISHMVDPDTVGQYTCLTDKNGKRIFEGDIIKIPDDYDTYGMNAGEVYEVYFGFGGFRLKPKYRKNARGYFLEDSGEVEVIGNIHDNNELLHDCEV